MSEQVLSQDQLTRDWEDVKGWAFQYINGLMLSPIYRRVSRKELEQEAFLGVVEARRRFDDKRCRNDGKPIKFLTYAAWWIRAYVRAYAQDNAGVMSGHRNTTAGTPAFAQMMRSVGGRSLQAPLRSRVGRRSKDLQEGLADPDAQENADRQLDLLDWGWLKELMDEVLTEREADILFSYHGLERTMKDVGSDYGLTRERIRQILTRAQDRLCKAIADSGGRDEAREKKQRLEAAQGIGTKSQKTA